MIYDPVMGVLTTEQAKLVHSYPPHIPIGLPLPTQPSIAEDERPDAEYSL